MSDYKIQKKSYENISKDIEIVILSAEFNNHINKELVETNKEFLQEHGFTNITEYQVPGAFETPSFVNKIIQLSNPDLILIFGSVIRGETTHYEIISQESARGLMDISLGVKEKTVLINGILTCENQQQAQERISDSYACSGLNVIAEEIKLNNSANYGINGATQEIKKFFRD